MSGVTVKCLLSVGGANTFDELEPSVLYDTVLPFSPTALILLGICLFQVLHLHCDFSFSGLEADPFTPNFDHPPHAVLHQKFTDGKDLPLVVFPPKLGFQSGSSH